MNFLSNDKRASSLLTRGREDVSNLRRDVQDLLGHTTSETLPNGAREITDQVKTQVRSQLAAGGAYAAARLRNLRHPSRSESSDWLAGAAVVSIVALGVYALIRCSNHQKALAEADEDQDASLEI